jgi:crotonobetainyl-CoA:carnitine CoA-transferase CaiB-like acyl-CoA transferase
MLETLRLVEFEGLGPAPFAAMWLAEQGAQVTVVHRPLQGGPITTGLLDRGKSSIALDLKDPEDHRIARALIADADALIEGLRPGTMERLRLGPEDAQALNPALVYGRMTGWGQTGPRARQAGHDLNYLALSGALFYAGLPGDTPAVPPTMLGDLGAGAMYLVGGLLAGVLNARATGQGSVIDAAIVDGATHMLSLLAAMGPGFDRAHRGASLLDGPHWSRCYACACGGHVAVQALEPQFYATLLAILGLADDPSMQAQNDPAQWPGQTARLAALFMTRSRDHWADLFAGSDACVAPVLSPAEAARDPHVEERGLWLGDSPAPAPRSGAIARSPGPIPARDGDRDAILARLEEKGLL